MRSLGWKRAGACALAFCCAALISCGSEPAPPDWNALRSAAEGVLARAALPAADHERASALLEGAHERVRQSLEGDGWAVQPADYLSLVFADMAKAARDEGRKDLASALQRAGSAPGADSGAAPGAVPGAGRP